VDEEMEKVGLLTLEFPVCADKQEPTLQNSWSHYLKTDARHFLFNLNEMTF
jgi:hypothetical protein